MKEARQHVDDSGDADADAGQRGLAAVLAREMLNGPAHFVENMVTAQRDARSQCELFEETALRVYSRDTQVGSAEINSDGERGHNDDCRGAGGCAAQTRR